MTWTSRRGSADLLDWLAEDLVAHNYDLKHTIELILTSRAYQLPASTAPADSTPTAKPSTSSAARRPGG